MIEVKDLTKSFGAVKAVDGVSFTLNPGEVMGFLGPNGAGKTTTMRILTGYLPPTSGSCTVDGLDILQNSLEVRKKIGYLPESTPLYGDMEVADYLTYIGSLRGLLPPQIKKGLKEVVATCGLSKVIGRKIQTLSKGYRQRVGLAQALIHEPEIVILDEPTVGLDPNQIGEIRALIKSMGRQKTVLLSTHILSEVEQTCDRVIIIQDGKIVGSGTLDELKVRAHGAGIYYVGLRASKESISAALQGLPGLQNGEFYKTEGDIHYARLSFSSANDKREDLFRFAVAKNLSLVELRREEMNLEAVFKQLTQ